MQSENDTKSEAAAPAADTPRSPACEVAQATPVEGGDKLAKTVPNKAKHRRPQKPGEPAQQQAPQDGQIRTRMLRVDQISPNEYNPNEMTQEEEEAYVEEVRRLHHIPKPLVVRRTGDGYTVVDGQHGLNAAKTVGLEEVSCEVIKADAFEAMRQSYARNQHGTNNPVKLGGMFQLMVEAGQRQDADFSNRALACELGVSEGTVRNQLQYVQAAKLRNRYAPGKGDDDNARLSVQQVREYVKRPEGKRDQWLNNAMAPKARRKQRTSGKKTPPPQQEDRPLSDQVLGDGLPAAPVDSRTAENAPATDEQRAEADHASGEESSHKVDQPPDAQPAFEGLLKSTKSAAHILSHHEKAFAALSSRLTAEQRGQLSGLLTKIRASAEQMLKACAESATTDSAEAA